MRAPQAAVLPGYPHTERVAPLRTAVGRAVHRKLGVRRKSQSFGAPWAAPPIVLEEKHARRHAGEVGPADPRGEAPGPLAFEPQKTLALVPSTRGGPRTRAGVAHAGPRLAPERAARPGQGLQGSGARLAPPAETVRGATCGAQRSHAGANAAWQAGAGLRAAPPWPLRARPHVPFPAPPGAEAPPACQPAGAVLLSAPPPARGALRVLRRAAGYSVGNL